MTSSSVLNWTVRPSASLIKLLIYPLTTKNAKLPEHGSEGREVERKQTRLFGRISVIIRVETFDDSI